MESSRRDLLNDVAEHRSNSRNNQNTQNSFIPKTVVAFPKIGVLFLLDVKNLTFARWNFSPVRGCKSFIFWMQWIIDSGLYWKIQKLRSLLRVIAQSPHLTTWQCFIVSHLRKSLIKVCRQHLRTYLNHKLNITGVWALGILDSTEVALHANTNAVVLVGKLRSGSRVVVERLNRTGNSREVL